MMQEIVNILARELSLQSRQVTQAVQLLDSGATIPFISRYRKEATGGMDEVVLGNLQERYHRLRDLLKRKETILNTIREQGKLTDELEHHISDCWDATTLEDLYLPYKPKRRTRASMAREKGLEPLAARLLLQRNDDVERLAEAYIGNIVENTEEALKGARDILAEQFSEDSRARNQVRRVFRRTALIRSRLVKGKEDAAANYSDYFDHEEPLYRCSSHRLLALRRGEAEGVLRVSIIPQNEDDCCECVARLFVRGNGSASYQVAEAAADACRRLILPSLETELAAESKQQADEEAIRVFTSNLSQLLLAPPLGPKRVLAIDPGFRTGCKVVCLDEHGGLVHYETIYPHPPQCQDVQAGNRIRELVRIFSVEAVAIGNGTAGRETERFISSLQLDADVQAFMVSEDGASVYSASKTAREEFPDQDVTVRGAVSIGRRLMDPLAELVKIDAKNMGVGQYQHDVNQTLLKQALDRTVEHCVNAVGVDLNTASRHLLTYVSGLGPQLAQNIVDYRTQHGAFRSRRQLMDVPRMGAKAFEQCAGFLRIAGADNPLDNTAVHPESYFVVEQMARKCHCTVGELVARKDLRAALRPEDFVTVRTGLPTLLDILSELDKPGRDPRGKAEVFCFDASLQTFDDLHVGMELPGLVTNVTDFGCFVDLGIKEKGLIHISRLSSHYVAHPNEVVSLHQPVRVRVESIDKERKRIALCRLED